MLYSNGILAIAGLLSLVANSSAFVIPSTLQNNVAVSPMNAEHLSSPTALMATPKATLTEESTWRLRFSLNGVPTKNGKKVGELFNVDVQFREEEGYGELRSTIT